MTDSTTAIGSITPIFGGGPSAETAMGPIQSVGVSAPLTTTGGANPTLGITNATVIAAGAMSAADKVRLDSLPLFPGVYVYAESDFPAPVAGKITLAAGTVYWIMGVVTLTNGNYIERPPTTAIIGVTASTCKIVGNYDGPLLTETGAAGTGRLDSVTIQNNSAGLSARAIEQSVAGSTLIMINTLATAAYAAFRNTAVASVLTQLSTFTSTTGSEAIDIAGGGSFGFYQSSTVAVAAGASHVRLRAGATISTMTYTAHGFIAFGANQFGITQDGATISDRVRVNATAQGAGLGTFTTNSGWNQGTASWSVQDCYGLPDSAAIGQSSLDTTVTVNVVAPLTYYDVSDGVDHWVLDVDSERFILRAVTGAQDGELEYTGTAVRRGLITGALTVRRAAGATAIGVRVACYINGVLQPASIASTDVTNRNTQIAFSPTVHVFNTTPTRVKMVIMNEDDTTDLVVERADIAVICGVVS